MTDHETLLVLTELHDAAEAILSTETDESRLLDALAAARVLHLP
jgi:hypothetical protein